MSQPHLPTVQRIIVKRIESTDRHSLICRRKTPTLEVDDIEAEAKRLKKNGVKFTTDPKQQGPVKLAIFSDTCGNLIQMYQPPA